MDLRTYLQEIAAGYDTESLNSAGHLLLKNVAPGVIKPLIPAGLIVRGSGGQGRPTATPWVAILDPDETTTLQEGIYLVWIFNSDRSKVVLTLNQGVTKLEARLKWAGLRPVVKAEAARIRNGLTSDLSGLETAIDIGKEKRQKGYGAANILAKTYFLAELPQEPELLADLRRMIGLYQEAIAVKRMLLVTEPGAVSSGSPGRIPEPGETGGDFKPKDRADYWVHMSAKAQLRRGDRHEILLSEYAEVVAQLGHQARNEKVHPRDLTMDVHGQEWLVEAKVVYNGNASQAVRAAIGQLLEYAKFLYEDREPRMMALFTEPIGPLFVELLESLNIAAVWKGEQRWEASDLATAAGLV
jgi:hypothetical protein